MKGVLAIIKNLLVSTSLIIFTGSIFIALSEMVNGDVGPGFGNWSFWLGGSIVTYGATRMHGINHGKKIIDESDKWKYVLGRTVYFSLISLAIYRVIDFHSVMFSFNQAFLFGIFFDPIRNKSAGDEFFYHGNESDYDEKAKKNPKAFFYYEIVGYLITSSIVVFDEFYTYLLARLFGINI